MIPKDELKEILDDMVKPFLWSYYHIRINIRQWHLRVRCQCAMGILRMQQRYARREVDFYVQKIAEGLETIDPQVQPLVERWLHLWDLSVADDDGKISRSQLYDVQAKIEDHYGESPWPDCFYREEYHAGLSARIVDCLYRYAVPLLDHNMPWDNPR